MKRRVWLVLSAVELLAGTSWAQRASNWRVYRAADGMPESACASVTVGPKGQVWTRHWEAPYVSGLDGYSVQIIAMPLAGQTRIYESPGGQLWTTYDEGLQDCMDGVWRSHPVEAIAAESRSNTLAKLHPIPLCPFRQGHVIFLLPDRLLEFSLQKQAQPGTSTLRRADETGLGRFLGMTTDFRDGGLWIAGARGLARVAGPARMITPGTPWEEHIPPQSLQVTNLQEPIEDDQGGITVVAEDLSARQRLAVHFDGTHWTKYSAGNERIRMAWRSGDNRFWAAAIDGLFELQSDHTGPVENEELSTRRYFDVAAEQGGAFWLATSDGLFRYAPALWQTPASLAGMNSTLHCVGEDDEGGTWFSSTNALYVLDDNGSSEYPFPADRRPTPDSANGFCPLSGGTLVMESEYGPCQFQRNDASFSLVALPEEGKAAKPLGLLKDGTLCMQVSGAGGAKTSSRLWAYDGQNFARPPFPQPDPDLGDDFVSLYVAQNGSVWLSSSRGIGWFHDSKWQVFSASNAAAPPGAGHFVELPDGRFWCATMETLRSPPALWEFNGREWTILRGGFDKINGLLRSRDGSIWVASNTGLNRFFRGAWIQNGIEEGLPANTILQVLEDHRGRIWADTLRGPALFHPEADPDPPRSAIRLLGGTEKEIPDGKPATLVFGGHDRWKYTTGDLLLNSYRMDQMDWSPFAEASRLTFPDPAAGKHSFQARAMDRNGNLDPIPTTFAFTVTLPWYEEGGVVWSLCAGLGTALFFAALAYNRHISLVRSHAEVEQKVLERTRELEIAHRELLHSQKMNALGTIAAGIAHDFNNILSIIKGSAQIIEDNLDNPQKVTTRLDRIKTVVEQGSGIVRAMLGFSRNSDDQPKSCDLNSTVEQTIRLLGDRFLRDVNVVFKAAPGLPPVPASQNLIQQILLNFIFNAADALRERGEVIISTGQVGGTPPGMVLAPREAPGHVYVAVKDFGCGIKPDDLPRIFEPFFTTKAMSARRGTGLGLSMVYQLAIRMEAGLAVETVEGQGSTFTLILALSQVTADPEPPPPQPATSQPAVYGESQNPDRRG
jgi:signal transduction histidine kinase/ligand-binding sensor domain-containing protein